VRRFLLALSLVLSAATAFAQQAEDPLDRPHGGREGFRYRHHRDWDDWSSRRGHDGVHLRVFRDYDLAAGATASEPVVVLGGTATINGHVEDDVVVLGGHLKLGPTAVVDGDVFTAGSDPTIDPAAHVKGKVDQAGIDLPGLGLGWGGFGVPRGWWPFASFGAMVMRLGLVLTISLLFTLIAPGWVRSMSGRAADVGASGVVGAIVEVLFVPVLLIITLGLVISVVGIPLLGAIPFVLAGVALLWVGGFAAVAVTLGARLRGSRGDRASAPYLDLLTGFLAITGVTIIAHFIGLAPGWISPFGWMVRTTGLLIEYVAWTIGLGAALSTLLVGRRFMPPPVPASA
jgi:hypothetical protein